MAKKSKKRCVIICRVSTDKQDTGRQIQDLAKVATQKNLKIVKVFSESMSGASEWEEREALNEVVAMAEAGEIEHVLTDEVARLARKNSVSHKFLEDLEKHRVNLYWHAQGMDILLPNGKRSPVAGIMFAFMSEKARADLDELSARIKSGLREAKRRGATLGRPTGTTLTDKQFLKNHKDVVKRLNEGLSIRVTAKVTGKAISTVQRVKKRLAA